MARETIRFITATLCITGLLAAVAGQALAAEDIVIANKIVARIASPGSFSSVVERAAKIDKRITQAISVENVGEPKMWINTTEGLPTLFIGKTMLIRVYPEDAKRSGISVWDLAKTWKGNFATQFPLAEPVIHMSNDSQSSELARAQARTAKSAKVSVPTADWAIVAVLLDHMSRVRVMSDQVFEKDLPVLSQQVYSEILQSVKNGAMLPASQVPPHSPGQCPELGGCPGCKEATLGAVKCPEAGALAFTPPAPSSIQRRIAGGLKLVRRLDEGRYQRDRVMIAYTIVKAVKKAIAEPPTPPKTLE